MLRSMGLGAKGDSEFTYNLGVGLRADYEQFVGKVMYRATWTDIDGFDKLKQDGVSVALGIKF